MKRGECELLACLKISMLSRVCVYVVRRGGQWVLQRERAAGDVRRTCSRHIMDSAIERIAGKREDKTRHAMIERVTELWLVICDLIILLSDDQVFRGIRCGEGEKESCPG